MPSLTEADALYVGDAAVNAVYVGDTLVWPAAPPVGLFAATNELPNPSFETSTTSGWAAAGGPITGQSSSAWGGMIGLVARTMRMNGGVGNMATWPGRKTLVAGDTVGFRVNVYASTTVGIAVHMFFRWFIGSTPQPVVEIVPWVDLANAEWTSLVSPMVPVPDGITGVETVMEMGTFSTHDPQMNLDERIRMDGGLYVRNTPAVPDYFDGDTPDDATYTYAWTGTPHNSASTRTPVGG